MKKVISLALVLIMVMGLVVVASAAETGSITITPPSGTEAANYVIYKVFDAAGDGNGIHYTVKANKNGAVPAGFSVDDYGYVSYTGDGGDELTEADIAAIKAYVNNSDKVATATVTGGQPVTVSGLENGYYYIATTSGAVVSIDSTNPNAQVTDKNQTPTLEKKIMMSGQEVDAASVSIGDKVTFVLKITIPQNASGLLIVHDKMSEYLTITNHSYDGADFDAFNNAGDGCTRDWYMYSSENYAGKTVYIYYTATVNMNAPSDVAMTNEAWLTNDGYTSAHDIVEVTTHQVEVYKYNGNTNEGLAGAGFKLKNVLGYYYTVDQWGNVSWTAGGTVLTTSADNDYTLTFKGLGDGKYTLEESVVPAGFNKAADQVITISGASLTGDDRIEVENLSGSELPSTGGIGTTLFYVFGSMMMLGAAVVMITKRRIA